MTSAALWDKLRASGKPCNGLPAQSQHLRRLAKHPSGNRISGHPKVVMAKKLRLFGVITPVSVGRTLLQTTFMELCKSSFSSFLSLFPRTKHLWAVGREIFCFPWLKLCLGKWPCYLLIDNSSKPCQLMATDSACSPGSAQWSFNFNYYKTNKLLCFYNRNFSQSCKLKFFFKKSEICDF